MCGICGNPFRLVGAFERDGTPAKQRAPTPYNLFTKKHFSRIKESLPEHARGNGAVMKAIARLWKEQKQATVVASLQL